MNTTASTNRISVDEYEKYHAKRIVVTPTRVTLKEILLTLAIGFVFSPFLFVTTTIVPLMGPITALLVFSITGLYLYYRRSLVATLAVAGGALLFANLIFVSIQAVKNDLAVPMFIFTALGIPVCFLYSMFVASRIWILRGGAE